MDYSSERAGASSAMGVMGGGQNPDAKVQPLLLNSIHQELIALHERLAGTATQIESMIHRAGIPIYAVAAKPPSGGAPSNDDQLSLIKERIYALTDIAERLEMLGNSLSRLA